ncbi:MAG: flagellin [Oscillospiraceae bacterium]
MVVQHNLTAINANRYFGMNNSRLSKSLEKLSSGYAINRAGDNAAGLAVSEKMRSQIAGINQGVKNAQDGISMVQTYEGALTETDSILQRMKTLATQSANGTYDNTVDRNAIQKEFDQLNDELNQIADTDFNGVIVLNGGVMADGTKAEGGVFDYSNATRDAMQLGGTYINGVGTANYDFNPPDGDADATSKVVEFTVEITDNGDGTNTYTWTASDGGNITTKENGGFEYDGAVIGIDTSNLVNGDSVKVRFDKNSDAVGDLSETFGSSYVVDKADGTMAGKGSLAAGTDISADDKVTSKEIADAMNALNGAVITETVAADGKVSIATSALSGTGDMSAYANAKFTIDTDGNISYQSDTVKNAVKIAAWSKSADLSNNTVAGTIKNTLVVGETTYKPADPGAVKVLEPEGVVSKSDALDQSTVKLTYAKSVSLQVGARTKDLVNFTFSYDCDDMGNLKADLDCTAKGLGTANLSLATQEDANKAIDEIGYAINKVSMVRGSFGAIQNRLEHKIDNLNVTSENLTSAESRIRDTNMAEEMMNFTKNQILSQASQSMLAQANQLPQGVLSLLQ